MATLTSTLQVEALAAHVQEEILAAIEQAVSDIADRGERYAKRLAPRRQVSYATRNAAPRLLTAVERRRLPAFVTRDLTKAQVLSLRTTDFRRRRKQELEAPEVLEDVGTRRMAGTGAIRLADQSQEHLLNARGRDELRRRDANRALYSRSAVGLSAARVARTRDIAGRAQASRDITGVNKATLGGRLRGEIKAVAISKRGGRIRYDIISPTPYAKFVEFPTTRTAAQPYMRPTLGAMKRPFIEKMRRNLSNVPKYAKA